ncbi:hypothetical protein PV326_007638 [Microctonus aethiopoides]|nr:hypothetical protein PV326_007638 [Microctonus aethiopoides]
MEYFVRQFVIPLLFCYFKFINSYIVKREEPVYGKMRTHTSEPPINANTWEEYAKDEDEANAPKQTVYGAVRDRSQN